MPSTRSAADARRDRVDRPGRTRDSFSKVGSEPATGQPAPEPTEVLNSSEQQAAQLRESIAPLFMYASMTQAFKNFDAGAYKLFRDRLIADCGGPKDPIETMLIEQLALAHFNAGLLQCRAANDRAIEATAVYSSAASRLMAEFRRSALALQAYRATSRQLANDPMRDIVVPVNDTDLSGDPPEKKCIDDELPAVTETSDEREIIIHYPGSADLGDQPAQAPEVARIHPRRKRKGPGRVAGEPAVGAVHGAANA